MGSGGPACSAFGPDDQRRRRHGCRRQWRRRWLLKRLMGSPRRPSCHGHATLPSAQKAPLNPRAVHMMASRGRELGGPTRPGPAKWKATDQYDQEPVGQPHKPGTFVVEGRRTRVQPRLSTSAPNSRDRLGY